MLAEEWTHRSARVLFHDLSAIGFCGGLTTFSTFAVEVVDLVPDGHAGTAALYAVMSVAAHDGLAVGTLVVNVTGEFCSACCTRCGRRP